MSRYVASAIVTALIVGLGTLSCLGFGPLDHITFLTEEQTFLDFFDFISNNILMPIVAILTCIFIGFVVGTKFITDEVESSGQFKAKKMFEIMIKWVCPIGLALVLATGLMDILGIMKL